MKCSICDNKNKDGTSVEIYKCRECWNKQAHEYYLKNKEKLKERTMLWKKNNKDKVLEDSRRYRKELKINALKAYSNNKIECACCGEKEIDFLCLDHIDNNGAQERREKKYGLGTSFLKWLKAHDYPASARLQVLCLNCNMSKRIQGGTCIHKLNKISKAKQIRL